MNGHLRIKSPWSQLAVFLGVTGGGLVLTALVSGALLIRSGVPVQNMGKLDLSNPAAIQAFKAAQAISSITLFLIPALIFALAACPGGALRFIGFNRPANQLMYGLAVLAIVAAGPLVFWLGDLNQRIPLPQWMIRMEEDAGKSIAQFLKADNNATVLLNVVIIALLPAICEELFFRGALQRILIRLFRQPWTGIIVTGILFSLFHFQFLGFLPRTMLGIILGALYWYSGSIWTSIAAHFVNNAVQVLVVSYMPQYLDKNPSFPVILTIISTLGLLTVLAIYRSLATVTYDKWNREQELDSASDFPNNSSSWR